MTMTMTTVIHAPKNTKPITQIWAFLSVDSDGAEGIVAELTDEGWLPLVTGDEANLSVMRMMAANVVRMSGKRVRLVAFTVAEVVEEIR